MLCSYQVALQSNPMLLRDSHWWFQVVFLFFLVFLLLYEIVWILSHHLSPHFYLLGDLSHHLFHHFCLLGDLFHHLFHHFCLLGDLSHHLFHHFCLSVHFSGLCYTISMILRLYVILAAYCDFAAVGIRGNLSPPVLAKNKETAVFRLVSVAGRS